MEESELEEGEACSYNITNDYAGNIDPDNDLSYIDEKLHHILGHLQKDFEGGVSLENLGSKYGGYGSFLPTYQRSPVWSHPKTTAKPQIFTGTRSPNNLLGESQSGNAASSSVPKRVKSRLASSGNPKKSVKSKKPSSSSRQESATKKPGVFTKQNSLKLRIKMAPDGLCTEKNAAAIYSGLGLDVSPSLSVDNNSLSGSEGMNGEPLGYSRMESPTSILNAMTSLHVDHCDLLSPLSDDLIQFSEGEKTEKGYKYRSPSRLFTESSSAMVNGIEPQKAGEKPSAEKEKKVVKSCFSADTNVRNKKGLFSGADATVKESVETNTSHPIAAKKKSANRKNFDASKKNCNGTVRGEMMDDVDRSSWGLTRHKDLEAHNENPKTSSTESVREDKKTNFGVDDASGYTRKVENYKGSKSSDSFKKEPSVSKAKSGHKVEPELPLRKQKYDRTEQEPQSSSKSKGQQISVVFETKMNGQAEKKEVAALKPQNDVKKAEDTYKAFFGDIGDFEEEEEQNCTMEDKDLQMLEMGPKALENMPEKSSFPQAESLNVDSEPVMRKLGSDASLPKANPVIIQEHWVACDKCGKWRLLPFGVFPEDLPEKWMCTMLNWLPGVNNCNVPEDETTKALYAMYQIPVPESQAPMQGNPSGPKLQLNQGDDNTKKKKKKGIRKIDNGMDKEGSRSAETNKTGHMPARNDIQILHGHSDPAEDERQIHKQKEKRKAVDHLSDESKSLKVNNKRKTDLESSMLAKKMKIESFLFPDTSEHGNGRPTSSSGVPVASADINAKPRVSSKMPKEEGGASDTGNSNSTRGNKKRKLRESHGSRIYSENESHERKKARVRNEEKEPSYSQGNGKLEKKNRSHSKREYGHVQNSIAATSSSSKISDSHKPRNSSHEAKCSPVESVSSSPMRISNLEKSITARKNKEVDDVNVFAAGSSRRFSDDEGEDDGGGSDRSQTRMKDKHRFHDSSVLDVWDDKGSLKAKECIDPSPNANYENGGHKELPQKLDHIIDEVKQSSDHRRRSNDSLTKKSGKGSSSRSKDKNQSSRSDLRDGLRHTEKKIYDGSPDSRADIVVRPNIPKPHEFERISERSNRASLASPSRPPSRGVQGDSSMLSVRKKVDNCCTSAGNNNTQADDVTKATTQTRRKSEPSPSPLRKEVTSAQTAHNTLKEATDLKHTADRLKNSVSGIEHIELYFQACLKFLHGAFLLEMSSNENARQGETKVQSMKIYSSTANLCGFCAHEYEKSKDMGAAALAYKCMEVAYMRVVNISYTSANRYRNELQTSLQMVPPGESPSSSASDVDNVNHPAAADRVGTSRGISSPLVAGNHVISAQNRSNILRLLQFAQDVNLAMDASRKSRVALAACIENLGEAQEGEGIQSIKSALDYNFQDMEGLLRLVKLAMKGQ